MLKISNETKVGIIATVAIVMLVVGFNLLKGKNIFSRSFTIYAKYNQVNGLQPSNAVQVNGLTIGNVSSLELMDKNAGQILVAIRITKQLNIPKNTIARISSDLLGTKSVTLVFGDAQQYLQDKDTINSALDGSITDALKAQLDPLVSKVKGTLTEVDSVLQTVNTIFDVSTQTNLKEAVGHLNHTMHNLSNASGSIDQMLDPQHGNIKATFDNFAAISGNLRNNNDKITAILANAQKTTDALANGQLDKTLQDLQTSMNNLKAIIANINSSNGTVGLLLNDKQVYNNLQATTSNLNKLLEDLRYNPKRYVHFSLFGKKEKMRPIPSDSAK
ncbi:phospholipid/cholesterol/gamma-HCH transport system substrate-binding protein [Chitinophaga costaii]|uniref:Phospholipid/cholesterol/gamma-HCH transport system substrate-binding protein n=1 Tax=Chitinophaga costaii TaxID=1335309 RepID=A0A1C4E421_9BACT|nr:MlaD family protein [Chitinophaga costaii]PUZ24334.1 MCE family protein [Chitinophaga costaii]SCC38376.1 phospholipid/cholesterol/gamma-HCH transport system substrate-binding protein [Chitinophaga costaii]